MKISKIYLRICSLLFACFLVCGSILMPVVTFASPYDLMIGSSSNALMTLELDDSDYSIMPLSSVGTVTNTISECLMELTFYNGSKYYYNIFRPELVNGRFDFSYSLPDYMQEYWLVNVNVYLVRNDLNFDCLPSPRGNYKLSADFSSDFGYSTSGDITLRSQYVRENAATETVDTKLSASWASGDFYIYPTALSIGSGYSGMRLFFGVPSNDRLKNFGGSLAIRFEHTSETGAALAGSGSADSADGELSSGFSDLSSSVDSLTEDLSSAAENLEYISTSQNLIIQGIDNVIMHISDQLYAFWDQLFNLIHLPTLAKMDDIISAINNMDLEIEVNLDGLKTTINNMSTAVQNKLQSTTDQITGGYDNSGIVSDQTELDSALNEYQQAEDELFDDAKDHLTNFEFDTPLDQFIKPIQDISYFMTGIFNGLAGLNIPIQFSLTLTIALILIGYYRIKR